MLFNMNTVIRLESVGKKYPLRHQNTAHYKALRDVFGETLRGFGSRLLGHGCQRRITKEDFWALQDISFEVNQGERLGIIGRNGAGKSTLLKLLSRITAPSQGRILLKGRVGSLLEVGTGFHPELTGRENIFLNGAILGMSRQEIKKKFDEIVAFSEVEKFLDMPVKRYSSGMYVRLAFAVAAHLTADILLVDEVLAVGDTEFQKKCIGKMQNMSENNGRTIVFVSHSMPTIHAFCDRAIFLEKGALMHDGPVGDVIKKYLNYNLKGDSTGRDLLNSIRSAGNQNAISEAWIEDDEGNRIDQVPMGGSAKICFRFKLKQKLTRLIVGFGVENIFGNRVFSLNNHMLKQVNSGFDFLEGTAVCHIPEIQLLPDSYWVSISIVDNNRTWIDYLERAIGFSVVADDVYGSGQIPTRAQGAVYVRGDVYVKT